MRAPGEAGLTLIEMLVVLAIIGVMSSVAMLGLGSTGRGPSAQAEARRLTASIQLAADEAMVTDRPLALNWDGRGYGFVEWDSKRNEWEPHKVPDLGGRHQLPGDVSLTSQSSEPRMPIGDQAPVDFTVTTGSESWNVRFDGLNAEALPVDGG